MSDPQRPHGLQPTRLLCPWDFPGKSTGVGCHCLLRPKFAGSSQIRNFQISVPRLILPSLLGMTVRKHLTGGFLCAILDLSGILCSFLIPEYSGIRGEASLSLGWGIQAYPLLVFQHGDKYPLPSYEPYDKSDCLQLSLSLIWIAYVL